MSFFVIQVVMVIIFTVFVWLGSGVGKFWYYFIGIFRLKNPSCEEGPLEGKQTNEYASLIFLLKETSDFFLKDKD